MPVTIPVSDVALPAELLPALDRPRAIASLFSPPPPPDVYQFPNEPPPPPPATPPPRRIEAHSTSAARLVSARDTNALAEAAHEAFYKHYPLVLSPDAVWFCLAQGFAQHVGLNAEALRHRLVRHEGTKRLVAKLPHFEPLGTPNPWPDAFAAFSDQIAREVGRLRDLVVADFSTTGPVERAASEVVLMDAFKAYFEYVALAGCGIPSITLLGTADDWRSIRRRAAMLSEFDLSWWTDALLPVLDEVVRSAEGHGDPAFWRSFFRYQSGSGPAELTGWILTLFPYLKLFEPAGERLAPNPYLAGWERSLRIAEARTGWIKQPEGPAIGQIPGSLASAPVQFIHLRDGSEHPLRFVAGLFGVTQDESTAALAPEFGWAILHGDEAGAPPLERGDTLSLSNPPSRRRRV